MRPVRLEMDGFAAFREPTVVDFAGAEYFALVGPTGAGKSTVIDAMTFALYGSVPRWDNRRAVALALAPSVNRGVGAAGVRRPRRTATSPPGSCAAPRGAGSTSRTPGWSGSSTTTDIGGDDGPSPRGRLRGDDRGRRGAARAVRSSTSPSCVVLPQGEFAEFLHAKPGDRQAILTRLLGLGVYERIAREANREASAAADRAALLAEQLGAYADATDEAVGEADERVVGLEALAERVSALLPEVSAAAEAVARADDDVATLAAEHARLGALVPPDGLEALDRRRRDAEERVRTARSPVLGRRGRRRCRAQAPRGCARSPSAGPGPA